MDFVLEVLDAHWKWFEKGLVEEAEIGEEIMTDDDVCFVEKFFLQLGELLLFSLKFLVIAFILKTDLA